MHESDAAKVASTAHRTSRRVRHQPKPAHHRAPVFRAHLSDPRIAGDRATIQALADRYGAARRRLPAGGNRRRHVGRPLELAERADPDWAACLADARPFCRRACGLVLLGMASTWWCSKPARFVDECSAGSPSATGSTIGWRRNWLGRNPGRRNIVAGGRLWSSSPEPARRTRWPRSSPRTHRGPRVGRSIRRGIRRHTGRHRRSPASLVLLMDWAPTQG